MLKEILIRIRRNEWLRRLGRSAFRLPVTGSTLRRVQGRILPQGERVWVQVPAGPAEGLWLKVDPYREDGYIRGSPEPGVQEALLKSVSRGDCFYDVGAHIGYYSLLAARLVGEAGCVVAFEPDPDILALLQENVTKNGLRSVEIVLAAVGCHDGGVAFERTAGQSSGKSSRRGAIASPGSSLAGPHIIDVKVVTLDSFAQNHRAPTILKIDVEGAESEVLKGAERLLADVKPVVLCEVHHAESANYIEKQLGAKWYTLEWLPHYPQFPFPRHVLARPAKNS